MTGEGTLLAIASNPPLQTNGLRTLRRVEQAQAVLGFEGYRITNLFAVPTYRSGEVAQFGASEDGWLAARPELQNGIRHARGVLLAYGTSAPTGPARALFRWQVAWLYDQLTVAQLPVWWVGGAARHPSRWQRFTYRAHPGMEFTEALSLALQSVPPETLSPQPSSGKT